MVVWLKKENFGPNLPHFSEVARLKKREKMSFPRHLIFLYYRCAILTGPPYSVIIFFSGTGQVLRLHPLIMSVSPHPVPFFFLNFV